ncbi:hypothetical protein LAX5112_03233 [Roseibium alexandrii]|uniref:Uncharacterized protein n=1 Tax=Roseibium alexandrii TaxID=388408 RepID=A0A0M7ADR1_9HYPH|nr:hypothetical protein LAX5112_03233 [Roseibium alexandrii]
MTLRKFRIFLDILRRILSEIAIFLNLAAGTTPVEQTGEDIKPGLPRTYVPSSMLSFQQ